MLKTARIQADSTEIIQPVTKQKRSDNRPQGGDQYPELLSLSRTFRVQQKNYETCKEAGKYDPFTRTEGGRCRGKQVQKLTVSETGCWFSQTMAIINTFSKSRKT